MIQAADLKRCPWDREFDDRSGPHVTGYRCREHPRATMLHTRSDQVSPLVHYVDGVRCAGALWASLRRCTGRMTGLSLRPGWRRCCGVRLFWSGAMACR